MTINVGDKFPNIEVGRMGEKGPDKLKTDDLFKGKRVVLFSVPGAFTPTCSKAHLPGFVVNADNLRDKGVDLIACVAVNDAFVMDAWGRASHVGDDIMMLADGNGDMARALGLELDASGYGMGKRGKRFSMLIENGVVKQVHVEAPGEFKVSSAEHMLANL